MFRRRSLEWNNYKAKQMVTNRVLFDFLSQYLSFGVITLSTPAVQWCRTQPPPRRRHGIGKRNAPPQKNIPDTPSKRQVFGSPFLKCVLLGWGGGMRHFPACTGWVVGSGRVGGVTHENKQIYSLLFCFFSKCWDFPLFGTASLLRKYNKVISYRLSL